MEVIYDGRSPKGVTDINMEGDLSLAPMLVAKSHITEDFDLGFDSLIDFSPNAKQRKPEDDDDHGIDFETDSEDEKMILASQQHTQITDLFNYDVDADEIEERASPNDDTSQERKSKGKKTNQRATKSKKTKSKLDTDQHEAVDENAAKREEVMNTELEVLSIT
jgi:hypothetical protein